MINPTLNQDTEYHLSLLTKCNVSRQQAAKIISMSDADLADAVAKFGQVPNKTAMQTGLVAAAEAEIAYRKGA
jgi:hypothetical protein